MKSPVTMEMMDVLKMENLRLRAQETAGQIQLMRMQMQMLQKDAQARAEAFNKSVDELSAKYQINLHMCQVNPDTGEVMSAVPNMPLPFTKKASNEAKTDTDKEAAPETVGKTAGEVAAEK